MKEFVVAKSILFHVEPLQADAVLICRLLIMTIYRSREPMEERG